LAKAPLAPGPAGEATPEAAALDVAADAPDDVAGQADGADGADDAAEVDGADTDPRARPGTRRWPPAAPRDGIPWSRMLFIGVICFAVWLLLDAPSLQRSAVTSPLGTRRTVSLDVVGPIAALSRGLGLSHLVSWADEALGRTPGGGPALAKRLHPALPLAGVGHTAHGPRQTGPPGTTPTSTIPALDQHPTAANPLRVLVMGDSIGIDLGQPLVADLSATGVATATLDGRIDTGLSRPDYFNWPAELGVDLANDRPRLVVVMMGANDPQSLVGANGEGTTAYGAPGWSAGYGQRVSGLIGEANAAGAHVLWVGMPPMARSDLNAGMQVLNSVVEAQVGTDPAGATFLASSAVLGDTQGNYTAYLPNSSGAEVNIRTPDGTHLSPDGGERLSQAVLTAMRSQLHIDLPG
jgi:hypothetical protein